MPELTWERGHTPTSGAVTAATSALAVASLTYVTGLAPAWNGVIAAAGAAGTVINGARHGHLPSVLFYCVILWAAAGAWAWWAASGGPPWTWPPLAVLAGGAVLGRLSWPGVGRYESAERQRRQETALLEQEAARQEQHNLWGEEWEQRLARIARLEDCRVVAIQPWKGDTGYTVQADLPGGATWSQLKRHEEALGSDLRLPEGCGVEVAGGRRKGTAIIRVSTVNVIGQTIPFPDDLSPTSIDHDVAIGRYKDATVARGSLAFTCGLGIGDTGSGKTNTLNVINAQLVRTVDALVWHIDTTGSGLSLPWLTSWAIEGTHKRPVIDWTAHTLDEARAMTTMALQIIEARKRRYQQVMRQANDTKLPASPDIPAIVLVVDETASLPRDIKAMIEEAMNTGRAVRVRVLVSSLRATTDAIPVPVKKRAAWRWGMYVTDPEELSYLFSGYQKIDPSDAPWPGCGFNAYGKTKPRPFKAYALTPQHMDRIAAAVSPRRPALDKVSREVPHGRYYPSRWARVLPHLYEGERLHPVTRPYTDIPIVPVPTADDQGPAAPAIAPGGGIRPGTPAWNRLFPRRGHIQPPEPAAEPEHEHPAPEETPAAKENAPAEPTPKQEPEQPAVPAQDAAMRLLLDAGPSGTGASRMETDLKALGYTTHRSTIHQWLRRWAATAEIFQQGSGTQAYYVHRSYVTNHPPAD
ncbi:hypothetical protein [Streptomyces sp. MST-110588]|uniref:hypothetical protein n=1 Tax=Streptomyces sp. MST-110588 TaxID=2833628 RepID=UPI001F5D581C|nr:hypothetical protein [Streptomyces sp. MST-110588]UNO42435.1 hypothetical protein KGS77_26555 [Streptomyces sp. MST-110588]